MTDRPPIWSALVQLAPNHQSLGYWRTREGRSQLKYHELQRWVDTARTLERGCFDALFMVDASGIFNDERPVGIREASMFPALDPATIVSPLGYVTTDLGYAITSNVIQDHPFSFSRKDLLPGSLDQRLRVAWNVVTSFLPNGFRNFGYVDVVDHEARYAWAEEYTEVVYKLLEGSWDDGASVHDPASGVFFDPAKVHKINHKGPRYTVEGPNLVEASPQRVPVLFQAGFSPAGQRFAAANAEIAFLPSSTPEQAAHDVQVLNGVIRKQGREPSRSRKSSASQWSTATTRVRPRAAAAPT